MATYTVTDDMLTSKEAALHFSTSDRRVLIGIRATLEILGIPVPAYAIRQPTGTRRPASVIAAAYAADNPQLAPKPLTYERKPNATAERIAAAKQGLRDRFGN